MKLYSASPRLLLRSDPDSSMTKKSGLKARVDCVRVNPEEQSPMQSHSKQRGQPPRMHEPDELKYEQKGQSVPPVSLIRGNCDLWGGIAKITEACQSKAQ